VQEIEKAAERGELTELVLMVIWNRLDVAHRDVCIISVLDRVSVLYIFEIVYFLFTDQVISFGLLRGLILIPSESS
jgi:hypothetical protein